MPSISDLVDSFDYLDEDKWADSYGDYRVEDQWAIVNCQEVYSAMMTPPIWSFPDGAKVVCYVWPASFDSVESTEHTTAIRILHGTTAGTDVGLMFDQKTGLLYFESRVDYWDGSRTSISWDPNVPSWWCMDRSGSNLRFRTAPVESGVYTAPTSFTTRRTMTAPSWLTANDNHRFILESHRDDTEAVDEAYFDALNTDLLDHPRTAGKGSFLGFFI